MSNHTTETAQRLELTGEELAILSDVLEERMGILREQLYHAEAPTFKDALKRRKAVLASIILKTKGGAP